MTKRRLFALISAALLIGGCGATPSQEGEVGTKRQPALSWNGLSWNGLSWNGLSWNGLGWNGLSWNGLGWNGLSWNGLSWNGLSWNGNPYWDWGLGSWINTSDANGDMTIDSYDRTLRLKALEYWAGCACPAGSHPTWTGPNPYGPPWTETKTFDGIFGLGPTWCTGAATSVVPVQELEAVSACLYARTNIYGLHQALSMRGSNSALALGDNEKLFMAYPSEQFWGYHQLGKKPATISRSFPSVG